MTNPTLWMVRAGEGAFLIDNFLKGELIAIGWNDVGDLSRLKDLSAIKVKLHEAYPHAKSSQVNNYAGQLYRFYAQFEIGHWVITYNPSQRTYHIGEIESAYFFTNEVTEYFHIRKVRWFKEVLRDGLSTKTKNTLGSTLTIFSIPSDAAHELLNLPQVPIAVPLTEEPEEEETLDTLKEEIEGKAHEFIKDKLQQLDWEEMQELVAGILRGMGYKTMVSPKGADRGKDIVASPDGLGLENPKIKVEVKHRTGSMGASQIRNFLGGLRPNDRGLYVSTGGFSKEAQYEAERANIPLTLIDLDLLVRLIIQHYDRFDPDTRALLPMKKIYWPV